MKIGRYDQKISFISEGTTADNYGGTTPTEQVVLETFASITQMTQAVIIAQSQKRTIEQSQLGLPATYKVSVQYRSGFKPTVAMRVIWRNTRYNITTTPVVENVRIQREWHFNISAL